MCSAACCAALDPPLPKCAPLWQREFAVVAQRVLDARAANCSTSPAPQTCTHARSPCLFDPSAPGSPCAAPECARLYANGTVTPGCRAAMRAYCASAAADTDAHTCATTHACPAHRWRECVARGRASVVRDAVAQHALLPRHAMVVVVPAAAHAWYARAGCADVLGEAKRACPAAMYRVLPNDLVEVVSVAAGITTSDVVAADVAVVGFGSVFAIAAPLALVAAFVCYESRAPGLRRARVSGGARAKTDL